MRFGNFILLTLDVRNLRGENPNFTFPAVAAERPLIIGVCACIRARRREEKVLRRGEKMLKNASWMEYHMDGRHRLTRGVSRENFL